MKHSLSFLILVILFVAVVDADIVDETCQKAALSNKNIHYDFCVAALGADPMSHSTDLQGLGIISLNLINVDATKIGSLIDDLLNDKNLGPDVKERLKDCQELYSDAVSHVKDATDAFNSKDYATANIQVSAITDDSTTCEDGFKEKPGLKSPLTAENSGFIELTAIELAITNLTH